MHRTLQKLVRDRAGNRCEYCRLPQSLHPQRFPIDHIIPRKHGGSDAASNLALSCPFCNWCKSSNLTGIDPVSGNITPLFHPRIDRWDVHFAWKAPVLAGLTPTGRATIAVLNMNDAQRIELRALAGWVSAEEQ